jgi:hypothetical protein
VTYRWWLFLHIAGAFGFLTTHGVSVGVAFRLRRERDPSRIMALLELSSSSVTLMYLSLVLLLTGGVVLGFIGHWWGDTWIWVSLGTLAAVMVAMYGLATRYYRRLRVIVGAMASGAEAISGERLAEVLVGPRPWILAVVGFGGLLFLLYLMIFKPF